MNLASKITPLELQLIDAPFTGAWQLLYDGFTRPIFMIRIVNDSNTSLYISYDGNETHDYILANDTIQIYFQANAQQNFVPADMAQGQQVWIQSPAAGGAGLVICTGYSSYR